MGGVPQTDLSAHLMETNEEFKSLAEQHSSYDRRLEEINARPYPSQDEQIEELRLKKLKLQTKDRMHQILRELDQQAS